KATRARIENSERVASRRDGRASALTEQHERNHHSGSDHAGKEREKECAAFPPPSLDYRLVDRRRSNGRRRRLQECTVDRVCLRRRIRAQLLREKLPALLA